MLAKTTNHRDDLFNVLDDYSHKQLKKAIKLVVVSAVIRHMTPVVLDKVVPQTLKVSRHKHTKPILKLAVLAAIGYTVGGLIEKRRQR